MTITETRNAMSGSVSSIVLQLSADRTVPAGEWAKFMERLFEWELIDRVRRAGIPPPSGTLWLVIIGPASADIAFTIDTAATVARAAEHRVVIAVRDDVATSIPFAPDVFRFAKIAELAAHIGDDDLLLFALAGDSFRPEIPMALKLFGCFGKDVSVFDFYWHEGAHVRPYFLHAFDAIHGLHCDYFLSRFCARGDAFRAVCDSPTPETPREVSLRLLSRMQDRRLDAGIHVPLPLMAIGAPESDHRAQRDEQVASTAKIRPRTSGEAQPTAQVSVIICTRNGSYLLQQLVVSLLTERRIKEVIVVANRTSTAHARSLLSSIAGDSRATVLRYDEPFNFSAQCNLGVKHSSGELLLFLNDDIAIVSPDWLGSLCGWPLEDWRAIAGPLLLYPKQTVQHAGMHLGFNGVAGHSFRHADMNDGDPAFYFAAPRQVSCLTGAALLVSRRLFQNLNGFDPMLATYLQDVDLCLRASGAGARLIHDPRAVLFHMESVSLVPSLASAAISLQRVNEHRYFSSRWASRLLSDPWIHPLADPHDESLATFRVWPRAD